MDKYACQIKKNKPEYLYIKGEDLGIHSDKDKTVKVIAENMKKQRAQKKIIT